MHTVYILYTPAHYAQTLMENLDKNSFKCRRAENLQELKKYCKEENPSLIFIGDHFKDKKIEALIPVIQAIPEIGQTPLIGIVSASKGKDSIVEFLRSGASDAFYNDALPEEAVLRATLRIEEAALRTALTSNEFFFSEAQEKEQGKRSGIFHFFNAQRIEVGSMHVREGRLVHATYGSIIKEDAFLQLACNDKLSFRFEDRDDIAEGTFSGSITNLLLEAYKLKDEMKKQEDAQDEGIKAMIIDPNRIERLLANRMLKNLDIESRVISKEDFTLRMMGQFAPSFLIIDYHSAQEILNMIWPEGRQSNDIPVIIYCDEEIKDINSTTIGRHQIDRMVRKKEFHKQIAAIIRHLFNTARLNHKEA